MIEADNLHFNPFERQLLDALQSAFPLVERPFRAIAQALGVGEDEALGAARALKASGVIRQISAIFDSARLGYRSALLAFAIAPERLAEAAEAVGAHPGVSHNYEREHAFNLWCTLAVPPEGDVRAHAEALAREARAERWLFLPSLRLFKIGVNFRMSDEAQGEERTASPSAPVESVPEPPAFSESERHAIRALQKDLPLAPEPFARLAEAEGLAGDELLRLGRDFLDSGAMRRYAAILRHRRAGFSYNVMSVWRVPAERAVEVGERLAASTAVSHCYQRPTPPEFPYSHYAMLHARSAEEAARIVADLEAATGVRENCLLRSVQEFKKTRVEYFTPAIAEWEAAHLGAP